MFLSFQVRHFSKKRMDLEIYGLLVKSVMKNSCSDKICKSFHEHTCDGVQAAFKLILIHGALHAGMRENTDQKNSEYGHFSRSGDFFGILRCFTEHQFHKALVFTACSGSTKHSCEKYSPLNSRTFVHFSI